MNKDVPNVTSELRKNRYELPKVIESTNGIRIFGKLIKKIIYTMDVSVIANCDADAVLAVYPWTPNTRILQSITTVSNIPVLAGIGGGLTKGLRSATIGFFAEEAGAQAVVLNNPSSIETISSVKKAVDIPIIYTVTKKSDDLLDKINAGVKVFNVAGGKNTINLISWIRKNKDMDLSKFPIMASGGKNENQIKQTIDAGADAITFSGIGAAEEIFKEKMVKYREK